MSHENTEGRRPRPAGNCMTHGESLPCYECSTNAEIDRIVEHGRQIVEWKPDPIKPLLCDRCGEPCSPLESERGGGKYVHLEGCRDQRK